MRLSLSETDHMFFEQLIRGLVIKKRLTVASHKRLKFAYGMLEEQLIASEVNNETFSVKQKLDRLVMLRSCITQECYVILVTSDNRSEAYRLFSTLNDRGKPLSNADLLRSKTLELLTERESYQQQAQKAWRGIISDEQANSNHFLTSYYPSQLGERASSNGLFDDYCEAFFDFQEPISNKDAMAIVARVDDLQEAHTAFCFLKKGKWPYEESGVSIWKEKRLHCLIKVLKHELCIPLLLSAIQSEKITQDEFGNLVLLLERFAFRYKTIVNAHVTQASDKYYLHAKRIRDNTFKLREFEADLGELIAKYADESVFRTTLLAQMRYNPSSKRMIKYLLSSVEDYNEWLHNGAPGKPQKREHGSTLDIEKLNIEHIYPQNAALPIADMEKLKHDLGNLTLIGKDSTGNKMFPEKRDSYTSSHISITKALASHSDWTRQDIERRSNYLADAALKIFSFR